jgi:cytochrome d ubiquinol oxidase subunit I
MGFYVTTALVVVGVAAWFLRRKQFIDESRLALSMTLWLLTLFVPLQVLLGDMQGLNTLRYQPTKLAAIEAHWTKERRAPLTLFAWPDQAQAKNRLSIDVPVLGSLILTHDANGVVPGLKDVPRDRWPPVAIPFFAFRAMVGLGLVMFALVLASLWLRMRGKLAVTTWFQRLCIAVSPAGFLAVLAGWTTTEVGRQPWTVYGLLRTSDSVSPSLAGGDVLLSFLGYAVVYLVMFPAGIYMMGRVVRGGIVDVAPHTIESGRPREPVVAPPEIAL